MPIALILNPLACNFNTYPQYLFYMQMNNCCQHYWLKKLIRIYTTIPKARNQTNDSSLSFQMPTSCFLGLQLLFDFFTFCLPTLSIIYLDIFCLVIHNFYIFQSQFLFLSAQYLFLFVLSKTIWPTVSAVSSFFNEIAFKKSNLLSSKKITLPGAFFFKVSSILLYFFTVFTENNFSDFSIFPLLNGSSNEVVSSAFMSSAWKV